MKKNFIIKGLLHGTKKIKEYSNPDILYTTINNKKYNGNKFTIKFNKDKNNFYIYHSYDNYDNYDDNLNKIYSGRWYDTNFNFEEKSFNNKNKTYTIRLKNINWENFDTGKSSIKNVKIIIYLTEIGFNKLIACV